LQLGYFAILLYVVGVPVFFTCVLYHYKIPFIATELTRDGVLRSLCEFAQYQEVPGVPMDPVTDITCHTITDEHVDILYEKYVSRLIMAKPVWLPEQDDPNKPPVDEQAPDPHAAKEAASALALASFISHPLQKKEKMLQHRMGTFWLLSSRAHEMNKLPTRREKTMTLIKYAEYVLNLTSTQTTWDYAADDPRLRGSQEALHMLFGEFHSSAWYWGIMEQANKLMVTITLTLVAPGSIVQTIFGTVVMFLQLIMYLKVMPYSDKTLNQVAFVMQLVLFLFFFCACFMQVFVVYGVPLSNDSQYLFDVCIITLTVGMFLVPGYIIIRRLRFGSLEEEEEEEESDSESESEADTEEEDITPKFTLRSVALLALAREHDDAAGAGEAGGGDRRH